MKTSRRPEATEEARAWGAVLRGLREARGLRQSDFGGGGRSGGAQISNYEGGLFSRITPRTLTALRNWLSVGEAELPDPPDSGLNGHHATSTDPEMAALAAVLRVTEPLDRDAKLRIFSYMFARLGVMLGPEASP